MQYIYVETRNQWKERKEYKKKEIQKYIGVN